MNRSEDIQYFKDYNMNTLEIKKNSKDDFSSDELVTYRVFLSFLKIKQRKDTLKDKLNEDFEPISKISSEFFNWIIKKLKKAKVYHKILNLFEKGFLNLCIFCKPKLKSVKFLKAIGKILSKVELYLKNFTERMIEDGKPIAEKISIVLCSLGNKDAEKWKNDKSFMFYLGLIKHSSKGL
ncbi:MAG: hypothetical protein QXM29_02355 [Nitrososphaerales archaeon]